MAMASGSGFDHHSNDYCSQPIGFLTPPPTWKTNRCSPAMPRSEKKPRRTNAQSKADDFHVIHKIPSGDSPYVKAKHVQLVDKDPSRAISLFWAAINSGDRVDSALKDMAVVMKQLDRSDEAVEAIKSFRHLSPPESQESLDNILVELYKQSGRIEEEIEMLQHKLKQVEEGIAFSGKRTKMARSQGKKIQITVEKEYSRLLGNLAWAYMQQKDFKSAEEHYRKALSFGPDKNKQCNLAVCLMHMNKLREAKFLLQTVRASSGNGFVDESYAKSHERASQMLAEFESEKPMEHNIESGIARGFVGFADRHLNKMKPSGGQWNARFCSQKYYDDNDGKQSSPLPLSVKTNNGAFTEFPYEKRADFDWRRNHYEPHIGGEEAHSAHNRAYEFPFCNRYIPKVPFTQPRRCSRPGDQRKSWLMENAYGSYCRKLSFGSSTGSESAESFVNQNVNYYPTVSPNKIPKVVPQFLEKHLTSTGRDWRRNSSGKPLEAYEGGMNCLAYDCQKSATDECALPSESAFSDACREMKEISDSNPAQCCKLNSEVHIGPSDEENLKIQSGCGKTCDASTCEHKKSWADMVEEDDKELGSWKNDHPQNYSGEFSVGLMNQEGFYDENVDSNIVPETPKLNDQAEKLCQKIESIDFGSGYFTQPGKATLSMNQSVRRSLRFDQNHNPDKPENHCTPPLTMKVLNFEGQGAGLSEDFSSSNPTNRRRLQVFQDITRAPGSPRP